MKNTEMEKMMTEKDNGNNNWLIEGLKKIAGNDNNINFDSDRPYKDILDKFKELKNKIEINDPSKFQLADYTNIYDANSSNSEYLCHFLEITSSVFGSSRPGNANQFGIKRNAIDKTNETYYISSSVTDGNENKSVTKDEANKSFDGIKKSLKKLCTGLSNDKNELNTDLNAAFNNSPIQAKQCLLKFVYLNNMSKLIPIYKKEILQSIARALDLDQADTKLNIKDSSILELNYEISKIIIDKLMPNGTEDDKKVKLFNIGGKLWQMFGATFSIEAKNMILYGAPGTGKTYSTIKSIEDEVVSAAGSIEKQFCLVQFHPSYSYEDFIDGIKPTKVDGGNVNLELVNGKFKEMCIRAFQDLSKNKENAKKYYFVADEINRAELSRVFGELLLCIEEDKRLRFNEAGELVGTKVQTQNSALWGAKHAVVIVDKDGNNITDEDYNKLSRNEQLECTMYFGVPENLFFIGTMNDIDRSIDSFDMALRRRFFWKKCECNYGVIANHYQVTTDNDFIRCCLALNQYISGGGEKGLNLGSSYELGHAYFMSLEKKLTKESKNEMWENHIEPLIREYLRALYTETEIQAKLKEAKKVFMPKTETSTPIATSE